LAHARDKQVYDELDEAELTDYLRRRPAAFDVIVSADTLVYFGQLDEVLAAGAAALRPGGVIVFTVEEALDAALAESYAIQPHGRYAHGAGYVGRLMSASGLQVEIDRAELRKEQGIPVAGLVVRGKHRV
jgi:predicted TPR repeat methyltransferase